MSNFLKQHRSTKSSSGVSFNQQHKQLHGSRPHQLPQRGDEQKHFPRRPTASLTWPARLDLQRASSLPIALSWEQSGPSHWYWNLQQIHLQICAQVSLKQCREFSFIAFYCMARNMSPDFWVNFWSEFFENCKRLKQRVNIKTMLRYLIYLFYKWYAAEHYTC